MSDQFKATLFGIDIDCIDNKGLHDTLRKAIVKHEFPNRNGALLEDMGQNARVIRFTAVFFGPDYERHKEVMSALEKAGSGELTHPAYGILYGAIESLDIRNDEREEYAELDISFVQDLLGDNPLISYDSSVLPKVQKSFLEGLADQADEISRAIASDMQSFSNAVSLRSYVAQFERCVQAGEAILVSVSQPANSVLTTVNFATDLPGRITGALANTVERYSELYSALKAAPAQFVRSFQNGMAQLAAALPQNATNAAQKKAQDLFIRHAQISGSLRLGLELGAMYKTDENARSSQKKNETTPSFDVSGKYLSPIEPDPIMTVTDIEASLAGARSELQAAIENSGRGMQSLKDMAEALLAHVDKVKLEREKIRPVTIENTLPLHLICLKYGHPYNTAERILAINPQIKNPSFVSGDIKIYV